ncbi:hypothetical protein L6R52_37825 [Myxococcota bacterium]|nr:hypothetical protein [Myxococcota bacterium]
MRAHVSLTLVSLSLVACGPGGWKLVDSPTQQTLRSVFVQTPERVFIAGDDGTVLFFDGTSVTDTSTVIPGLVEQPDFYGVASTADGPVVAGDGGTVMTRIDDVWTFDASSTQRRMLTLLRPTPSYLLAGGEAGRVITRQAGERTWARTDVGAPSDSKITASWGNSRETIVLATDRGTVIERVDGDWVTETVATSTSATPVPLFAVWSSTRGADLVTVGLAGSIFRREEGTVGWGAEPVRSTQDLYGLFGAGDTEWAVGASGTILTHESGTWDATPSASSSDLFAVHGTPDGAFVVAVGARGTIVVLRQ